MSAVNDPLDKLYSCVIWRLMPLLLLAQVLAFLDRVNIGTAKLQMAADVGLSASAYGLGAGIFFVGYFVFEVPSNLMLHRLGARTWIARIMVTWGIVSASAVFVDSANGFYVQRFLLGVAEAGFFPGVILYLTYWFPAQRRGRMTTLFMTASAVAGVISGPLSGMLMTALHGVHGLAGWRWMFLLEALPSILVGIMIFVWLPDSPKQADWLSSADRDRLLRDLAVSAPGSDYHAALRKGSAVSILLFATIYFLLLSGLYGINFWLPTIIGFAGISDTLTNGWLSAIPYACAAVVMNLVARRADRKRSWAWHVGLSAVIAGAGFIISAVIATHLIAALLALTLASIGIFSALPLFWNLPTQRLSGVGAAAAIALINSMGNLSGFIAPAAIGWLIEVTDNPATGMAGLGIAAMLAGILTLAFGAQRSQRPYFSIF
ncbi:MFS transporter [Pseudomonas sp. P7548]|uniref:MFS transporter n=1 Tax=Pseudomonas sp. P7548 TaxID=2726981 RepID=UPI0015B7C075|nr:MFS transporter [Pseudomonas sp. P7548]NWE23869.1 MFS transporter [Pseudomonas sp. P7548]